ncbi:MAG: cob(I)yrinic acid a,c-diamide adenosyltransferase [Oscillospiraceae bacterium]|nr:cob(I)yrinic acid a,c-diamide adenosyltransferase [Oscillospiraceae bacterium]
MLHIYHGDGKGKTTAAMGLALRMAGRGKRVVVAQFLKCEDSGERMALARLPSVELLPLPDCLPFTFELTPAQYQQERERYAQMLARLGELAPKADLLVLDEVCDAVDAGLVELSDVLTLLDSYEGEAVLTGRQGQPPLLERADYVTRMDKQRHPFDRGVQARVGVEC